MKQRVMRKIIFIVLISSLIFSVKIQAQQTGSFETTITFNKQTRAVSYYVPMDYDASQSYKLVVGLHGCGGSSFWFRNDLINLSDSLNAIIMCPDNQGNQMNGANAQIIPQSIDSAMQLYNIDPSGVYLTGFSCNGAVALAEGLETTYDFRGIIPFNPVVFFGYTANSYGYTSDMPTCICIGTSDPGYNQAIQVYDSLEANTAIAKLNEMPGIGHTTVFPTFDAEMMDCFKFIDSAYAAKHTDIHTLSKTDLRIYPNPVQDWLIINLNVKEYGIIIKNVEGKVLVKEHSRSNKSMINLASLERGVYFVETIVSGERAIRKIVKQ